ncbi:adhesion G protein-coupled receptor G3-like isoform X2 [Anarrhichthys ocellatus]|nr:adhesion G protein-coupled receptor G3-like isoform X2 [Anarrhichthys ocellatus]
MEWWLLCWLVLFTSGHKHDSGRSAERDSGRSAEGDSGRSAEGDSGRSAKDDSDHSAERNSGRSAEGDSGRSAKDDSDHSAERNSGRSAKGNSGRSAEDDSDHSAERNSGRSAKGDSGRSAEGDSGRSAEGDSGRSAEGDSDRSAEGDSGRSAKGDSGRSAKGDSGRCAKGDSGRSAEGDSGRCAEGDSGHCGKRGSRRGVKNSKICLEETNNILKNGNPRDAIKAMENLEQVLKETEVNGTPAFTQSRYLVLLHKPNGPFKGLEIHASDTEIMADRAVNNSKVRVRLPKELDAGSNNTIVFCMLTWSEANETALGGVLYENRLVGLSVQGKNVSGLQERVTITVNLHVNDTQEPRCVFLDVSTERFSSDGCETQWKRGQSIVTCCCDHLTYFGMLMVSSPDLPPEHQEILTYITLIGCSLSLFALVITVLLFITNRKVRADVSMKVHINLAIALIFLNLHLLPSQWVATLSSTGFCLYMALSLHYFLLATFSWMALEGFHLYLLLVRVFNIYIRRYLLKLSVLGWGVPAVIVSVVVAIDRGFYGRVSLDSSNPNSTEVCYIVNTTVKMVTTVGAFGLVFVFNMIMLVVTVRHIVGFRQSGEFGQSDGNRAKRGACTLLGVTTLLGITWGLVFFSFGYLTTPGLYLFCILNPLQGFFIFLWFVMSLRKTGKPTTYTTSVTPSTNS